MHKVQNLNDKGILQNKNEIKAIRIELLRLMALDNEWYKYETSELYRRIMVCSERLRQLTSDRKFIK